MRDPVANVIAHLQLVQKHLTGLGLTGEAHAVAFDIDELGRYCGRRPSPH